MKRNILTIEKLFILLILVISTGYISAEVVIDSEATIFYSYGIAEEDQMVPGALSGVYDEQKNGYSIDGKIKIKGTVENKFDMILDLTTKTMVGSPYIELQLSPTTPSDFTLELSNLYGLFYISDLLFKNTEFLGTELDIKIKTGKFGLNGSDFSFSKFGMESIAEKVKMNNSLALELETTFTFDDIKQYRYGKSSDIKISMASGGLFGEELQKLYDIDGGISEHGKIVVGEYAPVLFANIGLNNYVLPRGVLSLGASYVMNGNGIYSGNSIGASAEFISEVVSDKLYLPVSVNFAMFEKNIDAICATSGNSLLVDTTDFRETIQVAGALGLQYIKQTFGLLGVPNITANLTLSGSFSSIGHLYRDTLNIIGLAIESQYYINPKIYIGGGFVLGTISDITWQTTKDIPSSKDDYNHTFSLTDNFGYEVYAGLDFLGFSKLSIGFSHKKGLAMNYGLETIQNGMVKYRQSESELSDELWETMGIFMRASIAF